VDDVVSPDDNIDPVSGSDFIYLDVPRTGHVDILLMWRTRRDEVTPDPDGAARAAILHDALMLDRAALEARSVHPFDRQVDAPRGDVDAVVFVIHGIRDPGYWTSKIARRVVAVGRSATPRQNFATETATYGYFAMLPFVVPSRRRAKVEWLMDRYAECRARFPDAPFHFVGHSNGTYLLARALEEYPCARFERVVLAGSVIRTDYDWERFVASGQIGTVVNYVATADWVLALFPKAFQRLDGLVRAVTGGRRLFDLGAAGHDGFRGGTTPPDLGFVAGGHGAAIAEPFWEAIARFVAHGTPASLPAARRAVPSRFWRWVGHLAPAPLAALLLLVGWLTYLLVVSESLFGFQVGQEWLRTLIVVAWLWLLYRVVTWI
jgi:hypothetical protein